MTLPASQPNFFDSGETGAPTLNNVAGSVIEVIRACAKNGFNAKTVTSIAVASGVATATAASHGYTATHGKLILIEGAPEALLNGRHQPLSVATNTFTFDATGVADGNYTGTINAKRAPLGWVESFVDGGGTKAIYSRSAPEANAISLRIDDSGVAPATTSYAKVIMVSGATGVDAYAAQAPTNAQVSGGLACTKVANTSTAKQWIAIGTDRDFFLFVGDAGSTRYMPAICFYDGIVYRPGDAFFTVLSATAAASATSVASNQFISGVLTSAPSTPANGVIFSDETGTGAPEPFTIAPHFKNTGGHGSAGSGQPTDPMDFAIGFDAYMRGTKAGVRGMVPGNGEPFVLESAMTGLSLFAVQDADDGSKVLLVKISYTSANAGMTAFKLSEGWR